MRGGAVPPLPTTLVPLSHPIQLHPISSHPVPVRCVPPAAGRRQPPVSPLGAPLPCYTQKGPSSCPPVPNPITRVSPALDRVAMELTQAFQHDLRVVIFYLVSLFFFFFLIPSWEF